MKTDHTKTLATLVVILLAFLFWHHFTMTAKVEQRDKAIDQWENLFEEITAPLPKGDGTIQDPGVLPPKPSGKINPNQIITAAIEQIEATPYF